MPATVFKHGTALKYSCVLVTGFLYLPAKRSRDV